MARNTKASKRAQDAAKKIAKATKKAALDTLCECMLQSCKDNGGKLPYGFLTKIVTENKKQWPWISRDTVNSAFTRYKKSVAQCSSVNLDAVVESPTEMSDMTASIDHRSKGGRPTGSTLVNKRRKIDNIVALKNDIALSYKGLVEDAKKRGKRVGNGMLSELIERKKKERKLNDVNVSQSTIRLRIFRQKVIVKTNQKGGHTSPLIDIEETVIQIVLQMARIRQCLSPSRGLSLVNSLIDGHELQQKLIEWKTKFSSNVKGSVGIKYWRAFMERNKHRLVSVRGQKYELDRQNWTTYANFVHMYRHCLDEMVTAGVARVLDEPCWIDSNGQVCDEQKAFGCQVTHELCYPDLCFVGDEVGGNLNMKGDGHCGGQKFLTGSGTVPYRKVSATEKRFTMIGLTALDGQPVMCILIIRGKRPHLDVETGIDITIEPEGDASDVNFFFKNSGVGKYFPGGPRCMFRGKEIPALIKWNDTATITSDILIEVLSTLDHLQVIPRNDGIKPFLLLDGHGSRLELPFLRYINTPEDHWVVCLGVPYGTALWQIGDSKEQNGSFNIALTRAKQELVEYREAKCLPPKLQSTDLIPLINKAWSQSFARISKNKKAILDRGWNPLNKALLTLPEIRATMTDEERKSEVECDDIKLPTKPNNQYDSTIADASDSTTVTESDRSLPSIAPSLNFSKGTSAFCLGAILKQEQLMEARAKINKEQSEGKTLVERLRSAKRVTAGICYKSGTNRLGKDVFAVAKESVEKKKEEYIEKMKQERDIYLRLQKDADDIMLENVDKSIEQFSNKQLNTILKSLKRNGDKRLPTKKNEMIVLYHKWKERTPPVFDFEDIESAVVLNDGNESEDEILPISAEV